MSSGDQGLNGGMLASIEDNKSVLEMKDGIRKGSQGGRRVQSVLQRQRNAAGHKDGLGKYSDNRGRILGVRERQSGSGTRCKTPEGVPATYRCPQGTSN